MKIVKLLRRVRLSLVEGRNERKKDVLEENIVSTNEMSEKLELKSENSRNQRQVVVMDKLRDRMDNTTLRLSQKHTNHVIVKVNLLDFCDYNVYHRIVVITS